MNASLSDIAAFIDILLDIENVPDWPNALNGLQLANSGRVSSIGAAVDSGEGTVKKAVAAGVDLLLVHHGLFWGGLQPLTGARFGKVSLAIRQGMAIYSAHLPLDLHATLGNSALLTRAAGLELPEPFFFEKGHFLGLKGNVQLPLTEVAGRLEAAVAGPVKVIRGGPETTGCIGLVTGGAGGEIHKAAAEGVDTFITGEGPHWTAAAAEEMGVNLLYGGHYATETFGVKALAARVSEEFGLPWQFIDHPTGL
jgi:dinuclear metal center YbgI/SA1388 family protein